MAPLVLLSTSTSIKILSSQQDEDDWFLLLQASLDGRNFTLLNIYAPTADHLVEFLDKIDELTELTPSSAAI